MVLSNLIMDLKNEGNIMNLFNPATFVKGSLVGLDGNAFVLMGHFKRLAVRQGWTTEEWQTVTNKCMEGDYDTLIQTLMAHMEEE